jgi:hypothetical protein
VLVRTAAAAVRTWQAMMAVQACSRALLSSTPGALPYCLSRSDTSRWWVAPCTAAPVEHAFLRTHPTDDTQTTR